MFIIHKNSVAIIGLFGFFILLAFAPDGDLRATSFKGTREQVERYAPTWRLTVFKESIRGLSPLKLDDLESEMRHYAKTLDQFMALESINMPWDAFPGEELERSIEAKNVLRMIEIERLARLNAEHRRFNYKGEMGII